MHSTRGISINLVLNYIAVFLLLTAFPAANAKAIPPQALDLIRDRSVDNEAFALSRKPGSRREMESMIRAAMSPSWTKEA